MARENRENRPADRSAAGRKSLRKGKGGEREGAKALLQAVGIDAKRGRQFKGGPESPDIVTNVPGVFFEAKRRETLSLYAAVEKAAADAGDNLPVVIHRRNRKPWLSIIRLDDLAGLVVRLYPFARRKVFVGQMAEEPPEFENDDPIMGGGWNYRVMRRVQEDGTTLDAIHEVYYEKSGKPYAWTDDAVGLYGESPEDMRWGYENMGRALNTPVLDWKTGKEIQ